MIPNRPTCYKIKVHEISKSITENQAFDVQVKKVSSETKNIGYFCVCVWR